MTEQYVYGLHAVSALLGNRNRPTKKLYINQERIDKRLQEILDLATKLNRFQWKTYPHKK